MKKALSLFLCLCIILIQGGCSSQSKSDTYFIHAMLLEQDMNGTKISCICEKLSDDKKYFIITQSAKDVDEAVSMLSDKYRNCYFATCETYFITQEADEKFISSIAQKICESNILPSKSRIMTIKQSEKKLLSKIKSRESLESVIGSSDKKCVNCVKFFSQCLSGKRTKIPTADFSKAA